MRLSRKLWRKRGYRTVPDAGTDVDWSRAESYRRAEDGTIPTERDGKYLWVPPQRWAKQVKRLRGRPRKQAAAEVVT
jgi:hypothetical protein